MGAPIAIMAAAGGGALQAYGQYQAGQSASDRAAYQAQVAKNAEKVAEQNVQWAESAGAAREAAQAMKTRADSGRMRARMGASGVDVSSGSYDDVTDAAAALGALDTMTIRSNTAKEAYGHKVTAQNYAQDAVLRRAEGEQAEFAGTIGAMSSLLSSASSVGGKYATWQRTV